MRPKETVVILGAALVAAVAGGGSVIAYRNLAPYLRDNLDARTRAIDYVKGAIDYDRLAAERKLPETVAQITRGAGWRGVDYIIREAIARQGSKWIEVPEREFDHSHFDRFARVQERPADPGLEGLYLQRVFYFPGSLDRDASEALRKHSTVIDRLVNPSATFLVGINRTFINPATLERISLGVSQPR